MDLRFASKGVGAVLVGMFVSTFWQPPPARGQFDYEVVARDDHYYVIENRQKYFGLRAHTSREERNPFSLDLACSNGIIRIDPDDQVTDDAIFSTNGYAVSAWVKVSDTSTTGYIYAETDTNAFGYFTIAAIEDGDIEIVIDTGTNAIVRTTTTQPLADGAWHHVAWSDDAGKVGFRIDNVLAMAFAGAWNYDIADLVDMPDLTVAAIGALPISATSHTNTFRGELDQVSVWNISLLNPQFRFLYNNGAAPYLRAYSGAADYLKGWWRLGENSECVEPAINCNIDGLWSDLYDESGNQKHAEGEGLYECAVVLDGPPVNWFGEMSSFSISSGPSHGTLVGTAPNYTYIPDEDYTGPDEIVFTATDVWETSNVATVAFSVVAIEDFPLPIGVPEPEFGLVESCTSAFTHYVDSSHPNATDLDNPYGTLNQPRRTIPRYLAAGSIVEISTIGAADVFTNGLDEITAIAVDPYNERIYWVDPALGNLYHAGLAGEDPAVLAGGLDAPYGVAIDPTTERVYWTEGADCTTCGMIWSCDVNSCGPEVVIANQYGIRGLAVAHHNCLANSNGCIAWAVHHNVSGTQYYNVFTAELDGSNIQQTGQNGYISRINMVALDTNGVPATIYFTTDAGVLASATAGVRGRTYHILAGDFGATPFDGVAVDADSNSVVFTDLSDKLIRRMPMNCVYPNCAANVESLIDEELTPLAAAVDPVHRRLYYSRFEGGSNDSGEILMANLDDGSNREVIVGQDRHTVLADGTSSGFVCIRGSSPAQHAELRAGITMHGQYALLEYLDFDMSLFNASPTAVSVRENADYEVPHHIVTRHCAAGGLSQALLDQFSGAYGFGFRNADTGQNPERVSNCVVYDTHVYDLGDWMLFDSTLDTRGGGFEQNTQRCWFMDSHVHHGSGGVSASWNQQLDTIHPPDTIFLARNHFHHLRERGLGGKNPQKVVVSQNRIHTIYRSGSGPGPAVSFDNSFATSSYPYSSNLWIVFNEIYNSENGISVRNSSDAGALNYESVTDLHVIGNIIHDIRAVTRHGRFYGPHSSAIALEGRTEADIVHNLFYDCNYGIFKSLKFVRANIYNNIFDKWNDENEVRFERAPFAVSWLTSNGAKEVDTWEIDASFYGTNGSSNSWRIHDVTYSTLAEFQDCHTSPPPGELSCEQYGAVDGSQVEYFALEGDPLFVDPDNFDFHLDAASDAIDWGFNTPTFYNPYMTLFGESIKFDFDGNNRTVGNYPDLGPYEKQ
jgi:hypothetical protein